MSVKCLLKGQFTQGEHNISPRLFLVVGLRAGYFLICSGVIGVWRRDAKQKDEKKREEQRKGKNTDREEDVRGKGKLSRL